MGMNWEKSSENKPIGVIGIGSFGTAISNLLAEKNKVLVFARDESVVSAINATHMVKNRKLADSIQATSDPEMICDACDIMFPMIPSDAFREVMRRFAPYLHPYHFLIHGTKGLSLNLPQGKDLGNINKIKRKHICTMSEVIMEETVVERIGCLAGPNLAKELLERQPGATVIASRYNEVIREGQQLLRSDNFQVYGNSDIIGVELSGVLKNIIAIASGGLSGLGLGDNAKGLLISRGMVELVHLGKAMGGSTKSFLGLAGVGDLVTTCNSTLSRNFSLGFRLAKGEKLSDIVADMEEVAEGVNTVKLIKLFLESTDLRAPITENLYKVLFEDLKVEAALQFLMKFPIYTDIDFLD